MKKDKEIIRATYDEAKEGKAFTHIDESTMPEFNESDYTCDESDGACKYNLINRLRTVAFPSLPAECLIENTYSGILATDLFCLNTLLGSMIESKVVAFLNQHRQLWDDGDWKGFHFIRSNESFPDVRLVNVSDSKNIILGIELKSWFILSKEGEPSFRYRTASEACDKGDLLCIVPWYLSDAVCGNPVLMSPWVFSAKAAAEVTKRHWVYLRQCNTPKSLSKRGLKELSKDIKPYMENARDKTNYEPIEDGGNNFGRLARTGIMDNFVKETLMTDILGIPADNWRLFLKAHTDAGTLADIQKKIGKISEIPNSDKFNSIINDLKNYTEDLPRK